MICKLKKIWYCQFCGKHYHRNNTRHEKHCTANPDRYCRLCETVRDYHVIVKHFKEQIEVEKHEYYGGLDEITVIRAPMLSDIREAVDNCPACILTIMRLTGLVAPWFNLHFNYREEKEKWWAIVNAYLSKKEEEQRYYDYCRSQLYDM